MRRYNKFILTVSIISLLCIICSTCFAVDISRAKPKNDLANGINAKNIAKQILNVLAVIAAAVAVGMLAYIGIEYATKGAGSKATVKTALLPYLIGAMIIGSASKIAAVIISAGAGI